MVLRFFRGLLSLVGTAVVLGLSLLPLSALLLFFPAVDPSETVLTEATGREGFGRRLLRRLFALVAGFTVLIALTSVSIELVTRLREATGTALLSERGQFSSIARGFLFAPADFMGKTERQRQENLAKVPEPTRTFLATPLYKKLPPAAVAYWPVVIFVVYLLDLALLLAIGKVPLRYNLRNLRVRWLTNAMTLVAFTFVVGLLVMLLAFVSGMNNLTENTGVPGNVFVLSDGATDELFSNLGYGDLDNVEREVAALGRNDRPLPEPVRVARVTDDKGREVALASRETYYSINQPVPNTDPPRRRFVSLRAMDSAEVGARVHGVELYPPGRWFSAAGVDGQGRVECVVGEGIAKTLAEGTGKSALRPGDTFELGDMTWVVTGVMRSDGKTYGSEIWAKKFNLITTPFGKPNYTTLVLRTEQDTQDASRALAYHLSTRYTQQKLKAFSEPDYYAELTKTNNDFLAVIVVVAVVMAIGGVFGMMTTMFASIAQRIRDIGVLRLLGFKRWQVMVSFLLESLTVALLGGAIGCLLIRVFVNGAGSTSTLSGGGGGPGGKTVAVTLDVNFEVVTMGMLFALAMGRIGGLVPALSAMRMKILDSLR